MILLRFGTVERPGMASGMLKSITFSDESAPVKFSEFQSENYQDPKNSIRNFQNSEELS